MYTWVHKLERYFQTRGASENKKTEEELFSLEGRALSWF